MTTHLWIGLRTPGELGIFFPRTYGNGGAADDGAHGRMCLRASPVRAHRGNAADAELPLRGCQRASGWAYAAILIVPADGLRLSGELPYHAGNRRIQRGFCHLRRPVGDLPGWGAWVRTKAARSRAGSSTAKLSPIRDTRDAQLARPAPLRQPQPTVPKARRSPAACGATPPCPNRMSRVVTRRPSYAR